MRTGDTSVALCGIEKGALATTALALNKKGQRESGFACKLLVNGRNEGVTIEHTL
jgi:hypothetical protein